ncbi:MAG TPA: BamA/TamA family outer membrane protein [Gemmatimonadota bacterium]|nr:BamA/TamA family outer membrane protein [Gemmatimonadota bacterium]
MHRTTNRFRSCRRAALPLLALLLSILIAAPAAAQLSRFGKNKIQYDDFQWEILTGEHVDLYFYPEERELAQIALDYAEESFDFLEGKFSYSPQDRIPLVLYASHPHFEQTNIVPFFIPEGVAGFTEFLKGRVALPFNGSFADFRRVIRHELVHVFQARKGSHLKRLHPGGHEWRSPFWFTEGLAEYWSGPWDAEGDLVVQDLLLNGRVPPVSELDRFAGSFAAYKMGQNLLEYLGADFGEERLVELLETEWKYPNFTTAFRRVYGITIDELTERWHEHLRRTYFPTLAAERPVETVAIPVVTEGRLNFTPAIVPATDEDELGLVYVSLHSGYTTINTADLFGENEDIDTRVTAGRSGDLESFHPLQSLLDVSAGGRLAFVAKSGARDVLYVQDLESGRRERKGEWEDLVVLSSPAWSPGGREVAFVGLSRKGYADLYVWDTETERLDRLTNDRYLEATPSWAPTGDVIAFASDRTPFGREGARNLYLIDRGTRQIRPLTFGRWVDRDPDWSPDGQHLVFASDRAGTLDLYVIDRDGNGHRATSFAAGTMHPRWYRQDGRDGVVFTSYQNMAYDIYRTPLPVDAPSTIALTVDPGVPQWHWGDYVPEPGRFVEREYEQEFGLDFATAALAFSEDGGRGEGAQVFFSDMLGDHLIALQVNSQSGRTNLFSGFTGVATYVNLKQRLNWGVSAYRLRSFFTSLLGPEFDRQGFDREGIGIRNDFFEERYGATGILLYPFSKFQRIEAELTFERNELAELADSAEVTSPLFFRDAWLTIGSLGYVFDNTLWGPVGPIDGHRVNLTVAPVMNLTAGGLESTDVLLDARKYFRTSLHTTYAVRARGRYSSGDVPTFYFLGGPLSLRGYPSFLLNGSRTVLLNQEWRFPILRPNPFRRGMSALLAGGIWGGLFVDLGNAWTEDTAFRDDQGELQPLGDWPGLLGSYGASIRYPLFGPLILRFDWARRFDLEDKRELFPGEQNDTHFSFFVGFNY